VGTFRWASDFKLLNMPKFEYDMLTFLHEIDKGWGGYVPARFPLTPGTNEIKCEPH